MAQKNRPVQILLIEDSPGDSWLIEDILRSGRIPKVIHKVGDGEHALRYIRRAGEYAGAERPDLILLDLNLPGMPGFDILREIKADPALRSLTVIVLTTSDALADVNAAYDLNANCYVVKPIDLAGFTQAIRGIEEFWLGVAMLPGPGNQAWPRPPARDTSSTGNGPSARLHEGARILAGGCGRRPARYRFRQGPRRGYGRRIHACSRVP